MTSIVKQIKPQEFKLSNDIPVILQPYEGPVAAIYWWVNVGSADESTHEAGFAHFLEHMLFKDAAAKESGKASSGQIARAIESLGGDINAYTSFDQTVYHVTCAAQHWEKILDAFGSMVKPQKFLKADFEREREVILEELRKNEDSPNRQAFQALFSSSFLKHPYGRPVIGFKKSLKAAKTLHLEKFYKTHYVSSNMGVVLVGPLESQNGKRKKQLLELVEKYFGSHVFKKTPSLKKARPFEPPLRESPKWSLKPFDVKTPNLLVSFRVPELKHEDIPALDLLSGILGSGELSRLYQKLFYQTSLVISTSGGLYVPKDPGILFFQFEADSVSKLNLIAEGAFQVFKNLGEEGPTPEELSRVMINAESERLYATQTADGMANRVSFLKFIAGDLSYDDRYLEELRAVDHEKIKKVAAHYLDYRRMTGVLLVPKSDNQFDTSTIQKKSIEMLNSGPDLTSPTQKYSKTHIALENKPNPEKELKRMKFPSGLEVCFYPRPSSHVFSIHAVVLGGVRLEIAHPIENSNSDWGSSYLMALTWTKGTSQLSASQISNLVEGRAAGMDGFSGRNSVGLQMTGLSRDWPILSDTFGQVLLDAKFPQTELEHSKRIAIDAIRGIDDHSSQLCSRLFLETLFEKHPYGRMVQGSIESIEKIRPDKLQAFHRAWLRPERLIISISGAVSHTALETWINQLNEQLISFASSSDHTHERIPDTLENEPPLRGPRWIEKPLGREQLHIILGGLGTQVTSPDRFSVRLLQTLLGGQSGRLFIELREKKSLAYTVSPLSFEGIEKGYIGTYIACSPQKKEEALEGIQKVLETLASKGPTLKEIKRAKEFFLGRRAMELQSDASLAAHYGLETLYQQGHLSEKQILEKINSIKASDIQMACSKYFVKPQMVTSIVG